MRVKFAYAVSIAAASLTACGKKNDDGASTGAVAGAAAVALASNAVIVDKMYRLTAPAHPAVSFMRPSPTSRRLLPGRVTSGGWITLTGLLHQYPQCR
jgi:hypothetical protein